MGCRPELPDRVEDALADALLRSPAARAARLADLIARHPDHAASLRARIAELDDEADVARTTSAASAPAAAAAPEPGTRIDRYTLLRLVGEGGMGAIWLAEQREPIRRNVAVKVVKLGMDTREVMARFETERQALALMDHPNIARVLDAGATAAGRPYFVMEYIEGTPILDHCVREGLSIEARLELFVEVCHAIQHAHQKGVIHRDIKPSNVLVARHDGAAAPKVIDFGVAKATGDALNDATLWTTHHQLIGTPAYMSPEQVDGSGRGIDTRSDIYALGVLLYELLTGTTPFDNQQLLTGGFVEMVRTIREVGPPRPSTRASTHGGDDAGRGMPSQDDRRRLHSRLVGDLDWIVMKCLEKDRERRYDTAKDLAADIRRHLAVEPVVAGPPGVRYRLSKFVARNRGLVTAVAAVAATLVLGVVASAIGWRTALDEKASAEAARAEAERVVEFLGDALAGVGPSVAQGRDVTMLREMMDRAAERIMAGELDAVPLAKIELSGRIGGIYRQLAVYDAAEPLLVQALDLARSTCPGDHEVVAEAIGNLATLRYVQGDLTRAVELHGDALAMNRRLFDGDHRRIAAAQGRLAVALQAGGEHAEAERLYRGALAMNQRLFDGDHPSTAWCMQSLATVLSVRGDDIAAERLYRDSLAMHRRLSPGDNPRVATGLGHLAILLHVRGDLEAAETHYRDSLAMNQRLHAGDHPSVATGLNALAMLLADRGAVDEAGQRFAEAMEMKRRLFPEDAPNRAVDLDALANFYASQRRFADAIPLFEQALAAREAKLGREHLDTRTTIAGLGVAYAEVARFGDALPLLEEAAAASLTEPTLVTARPALLTACVEAGGSVPAETAARIGDLVEQLLVAEAATSAADGLERASQLSPFARALLGLGRYEAAARLTAECLGIRRATAPDDWATFRCESLHGRALLGQQRLRAAEAALLSGYRGLLERAARIPPAERGCVGLAAARLVTFYEAVGNDAEVAAWRRRVGAGADGR